eukprot:scaffold499_cov335-Pavlova_lutheri.AAC.12
MLPRGATHVHITRQVPGGFDGTGVPRPYGVERIEIEEEASQPVLCGVREHLTWHRDTRLGGDIREKTRTYLARRKTSKACAGARNRRSH